MTASTVDGPCKERSKKNGSNSSVTEKADDRDRWRVLVEAAKRLQGEESEKKKIFWF